MGLPSDSATWRGDQAGWTNEHELLARIAEAANHWGVINALALGVKDPPPVAAVIKHPERAGGEEESGKKPDRSKGRLATPADIAREASERR